jgi:hypothetical protein
MDKHLADAIDSKDEGFWREPVRRLVFCLTLILLVVGGYRAIAQEAQDMSAEFSPTLVNGDSPLLTPGTIIGPNNVDEYKNLLDQVLVERVRVGDLQLTLGPELDFPVQSSTAHHFLLVHQCFAATRGAGNMAVVPCYAL